MISSFTTPKPLSLSHHCQHHHKLSTFLPPLTPLFRPSTTSPFHPPLAKPKPISAANSDNQPPKLIIPSSRSASISASNSNNPPPKLIIPSSPSTHVSAANPQPQNFYQPFRPPSSPVPSQYRSLDTAGRIEILANRLGQWFEYAPLIDALFHEGFTPPIIEELTGITGVEQNRLVVAAQVRQSLADPDGPSTHQLDPELLSYFDNGGSELLYEIRLLSASQRAAAACYLVLNRLDGKGARELARAVKDFPIRRGDPGWESFDYNLPGDCLSFTYFRLSREHREGSSERQAALKSALEVAESDMARDRVLEELEGKRKDGEGKEEDQVRVPVVRMMFGEVAEATTVVVLPVCKAEEKDEGVLSAPFECRTEGEFGVVASEKGWRRWVVLPGWEPVVTIGGSGGVAVEFPDAKVLPWRADRWYKEDAILVVADRRKKEVAVDDGFYLVINSGELKVKRGAELKEMGVKESLGMVVLVVRPPKEVDDQLSDEDWE